MVQPLLAIIAVTSESAFLLRHVLVHVLCLDGWGHMDLELSRSPPLPTDFAHHSVLNSSLDRRPPSGERVQVRVIGLLPDAVLL